MHPPLTDAAIGAYASATLLCILSFIGLDATRLATAWWVVLLAGLAFGGMAAVTGLADWLGIDRASPAWRTATTHMLVMLTATGLFIAAAVVGYWHGYAGTIGVASLVLTVAGFLVLVLGGRLGGTLVFVHGLRVAGRSDTSGRAPADGAAAIPPAERPPAVVRPPSART